MTERFLVIDLTTGALDGFYFREELARESLTSLRADYPQGSWVLVEVRDMREGACIPDEMFWLNKLAEE